MIPRSPMLLIPAVVMAVCVVPAPALGISIGFTTSMLPLSAGQSGTIGIEVLELLEHSAPSLGTFDLTVHYDPALLRLDDVVYGDPEQGDQLDVLDLGSWFETTAGPGYVSLFELSFDSAEDLNELQAADFVLAMFTVTSLTGQAGMLSLHVNALGDATGSRLPATVGPDATVAASVPETSGFPLLVISVALLLGWYRRARLS